MAEPQAEKTNRDRLRDLLQGGMEKSSVRVATNFAPLINQLGISPESTAALLMGGDKSPLPLGMGVADFVPFLGTALGTEDAIQDLKDARQSIKNDDYLGAGVDVAFGALGLLPGMAGTAKYGRKAIKGMRNIDLSKIPALMRPPTHAKLPTTPVEQGMAKGGSARSRLAELLSDDGAHMAAGGKAKALVKGLLKPDTPAVNRIEMGFKDVAQRVPELTEAANLVKAGKMSADEFAQVVNRFKPVTRYDFVPKPATRKEAMEALHENKRQSYGGTKQIEGGEPADLRLDIPAYTGSGVWVNSIHRKGSPTVYGSTSAVDRPEMILPQEKAFQVATGEKSKSPFAVIRGEWNPLTEAEVVKGAQKYLNDPDWIQVGMDPERHSYFYDRTTMRPVVGGDKAVQIGPLVLVKNPQYGNPDDFKFAKGGEVHMARGGKLKEAVKGALTRTIDVPPMGINVRTDKNANLPFADLIVDGRKLYESRESDSLRPYVNKNMSIVRTGSGPAKAIGSVMIEEPMLVDAKKFRELQEKHLVPEGSAFDIAPDGQKYLYPLSNPLRFDQEFDVGRGIKARKVIVPEQEMAKGGRAKAMLKSAIGRGRADIREPQTTTSITKEGGGNWLAGSVEGAMSPLKRQGVAVMPLNETELAERAAQGYTVHDPATGTYSKPDPMNQFIDKQLTRYVKNQMATKEDPIRLAADAFPAQKAKMLAEKQAQIDKATADMEKARQARGFTPEMMTSSQARIRELQKEMELIERRVGLHVNPDQLNFNPFTYGKYLSAGQQVVAQSPTAKSWEGVSDLSISPMIAKQLLGNDGTRMGRGDSILENNPWLNKVPEETSVYSMTDPQGVPSDLGFDHLIDELRNATNPASGLPKDLLIDSKDLSKWTVPQVAEHVDKINAWRAAQQAEADIVRASNIATVMHKDFPDKGYSWMELRMPETPTELPEGWTRLEDRAGVLRARSTDGKSVLGHNLPELVQNIYLRHPDTPGSPKAALEDALKYEGEQLQHCVGGYCPDVIEGRSRIFSLRDAKYQPHVTVETSPRGRGALSGDVLNEMEPGLFDKYLSQRHEENGIENMHDWFRNARPELAKSERIVQIKGKGNKKPNEEYLPFVQDFVKSGKWSDVGDFSNTGLMRIAPESNEALYLQKQNKPIPEYVSDQEYEEIRRGMADAMRSPYGAADEMKEGGVVHMDKGGASESPETPEQQFQHYLRMLRINATGGKDQHGTGVGGRLGLNIPVSKNISIEPYVQGFAFKPGSGKLINGGAGGANLNIRFKNGGEVHMKKGGKAKGAIKSGLRNMLSETTAPPPGVEPIVVRPKDERELKGAMRPSVEPVRGQTSKEMRAAQREQLTPQQQEKLKALKSQYPDFAQATKFMMPGEVSKIIENPNGVKEMNALLQVIPNAKEMAAVAKTGEAKRGWYRASTQAIINVFGDDAPRFSSLLAALSPQNSVETNLLNTLNTWKNWTAAGRPTDDRSIREVLGRSVQGTKGEESVLEAWAQNAIRSLSAQDPSKVVLSGAKVDSFWRNLADDVYRVTNDAWMANGMGVQQKLFGQKPTDLQLQRGDPGLTPGYIGASARTREAGQMANMFPSEAQETTWSTFMPLYEMQERLGLPAREILQRGLLTPEVIRGTPDFSTLFNDPTYRRILDESGYGEQLSNLRPHQWPEARIDLNLSEQRDLENTARRLEGLRSDRNKETRSRTVSLPSEGRASRAYPFETAEYIPMRGAGHAEELIDAPFGQRQAFTSKMSGAFTDFAGKDVLHGALDLKPLRATGALGSYQPPGRYPWIQLPKEVQPMFALGHESPVTASLDIPKRTHDKMRSAAALRGAMTGQGGQAYNAQIPDPNGTSLFVPLDKKVGKDEMTFSAGLVPENTFLADTGRGMSVINYGDKYGGEEAELIAQRLGGTDSVPTTSRGDYIDYSKDWQQPQGSGAVTTKMLSHMGPLSVRDFNELSKAAQVPAGEVYDAYRALESNKGYVVREDLMNMLRILRNQGIPGVAAALAAGEALPSEPEQAKRTGGLASLKYGGGRA